ncbi:hypothetical protein F5Y16DRAFT_370580 [Xylariaceae sp. FL0255]|nr:hypothetical protein F5Y16DRAFT_370580 [Xylariaceae sp. FL0255]
MNRADTPDHIPHHQQQHPHPISAANTGTGHDASSSHYNAALRGASLAFQKTTKPQPNNLTSTPTRNNATTDNGAVIAATSASRDHSLSRSPSYVAQNTTGNSLIAAEQSVSNHRHLLTPTRPNASTTNTPDTRSPSFIAATLAASRSVSPNPQVYQHNSSGQQKRGGKAGHMGENISAASSVTDLDLTATDTTSIPPTDTLISLFERRGNTDPVKKDSPIRGDAGSAKKFKGNPGLRPITPPRTSPPAVTLNTSPPPRLPIASQTKKAAVWPQPPVATRSSTTGVKPPPREVDQVPQGRDTRRPPTPPPTRRRIETNKELESPAAQKSNRIAKPRPVTPPPGTISRASTVVLSPQPVRRTPSQKLVGGALSLGDDEDHNLNPSLPLLSFENPRNRSSTVTKVTEPPIRSTEEDKRGTGRLLRRSSSSLSNDTFVSASSAPSPAPDSPRRTQRPPTPGMTRPLRPLSVQNTRNSFSGRPTLPPRQSASGLPLESLTSAIMAGSLASARATPSISSSVAPTPPPTRNPKAVHMRQTLRVPKSKSDDEGNTEKVRRSRKHLDKLKGKKKHAHHEGSRKRWREEITARERKRYEGVWASNRGLLLLDDPNSISVPPPPNPTNLRNNSKAQDDDLNQLVANVVVRDIWSRSRLPFDELEEVWDLVDGSGRGVLDKAEFVVGMWLIDQRLRGRKIPRKVSESVWGSARGLRVAGLGKGKR